MPDKQTASTKTTTMDFPAIKKRRDEIISAQGPVKEMYKNIANMYWMDNSPSVNTKNYDSGDIRYTKSPNARNEVTGLHRMLRTTKPKFSIDMDDEEKASKIEDMLNAAWEASCARKRAPIHSDLALSAILFTDANLHVTSVQDLINTKGISPVRKTRLEALQLRTPFIFEADSAFTTYPVWGEDGLGEYLRQYKIKGRAVRDRWGVQDAKDDTDYTINTYWNIDNVVCVWADEIADPLQGPDTYDLPDIPCFSASADGTDIFDEEIRKRQPFLYALYQSKLANREDELLTTMFTSAYSRGVGPLALLDPTSVESGGVKVNYAGLFRYVIGKGTFADDKAFDNNLIQLKNMLDELGQRSTINSQTLGENIASGTPYSGFAMASQNGRIPIVPIQEACEKVIKDAASFALRYYKQAGMKWKDLSANDIPDNFELTVKLEVDLPQDQFKMAQTAAQLKGIVSLEWIHNLLQIHDSDKMIDTILSEQATQAAFQADMPNLVQQMIQMATQAPTAPGVPGGAPTLPTPTPPPTPPNAPPSQPMIPGGPQAAMAGGGTLPATEPMQPTLMPGAGGG